MHLVPLALALVGGPALAAGLPDIDEPLRTGARAAGDAAVVIGVEDYVFVPDVPHAARDARAFYDYLVYTHGVPAERVQLFEGGAGREQILDALTRAAGEVGAEGTLWLYFAGHGAASTSTGARLLLGDDVRQDPAAFEARAVSLDEVRGMAGDARLMMVLDACYNGLGRTGEELVGGKRFLVPGYAVAPADQVLEWSAASGDQLSGPLDAVGHGAFTYFVLGALRGWADGHLDGVRDGRVTAEEANLFVESALRKVQITSQTPELVVGDASSWVLSSGELEPAPELSAATAPAAAPAPTALDVADEALVTATLQEIVDRCAAQNNSASVATDEWHIRWKMKKGALKGLMVQTPSQQVDPNAPGDHEVDQGAYNRYRCIRDGIKSREWSAAETTVVRRVVRTTALR